MGLTPGAAAEPTPGRTDTAEKVVKLSAAPRSLSAEPGQRAGSVRVSWQAPASSAAAEVTSYEVALTPAAGLRHGGRRVLPASRTHTSFRHLSPGRQYHISVRALSAAGRSPSASADYLAARVTRAWVFATDTTKRSVVRVPVHGGRLRTIAPSGTAWAVNTQGDVYVVDREAQTVSRTTARRPRTTVIASGLRDLQDVQLDAAGQVYVVAGTQVVRMSATGARRRVVADPASTAVFVRPDGTVLTTTGNAVDTPLQVLSYPPGGGTPRVRAVLGGDNGEYYPYRRGLASDAAGNLFVHWVSGGGSDFQWWFRVPAGTSTRTPFYTRMANYAFALDPGGRPYLAQTTHYCDTIPIMEGVCTPDFTVHEILRYDTAGTPTAIPIEPFVYDQWGLNGGSALAVDRAGRLFVALHSGPSVGLREYAPTGGSADVLARGTFTDVARNN